MGNTSLLLRALRWRGASSLALLLVATAAILAAAVGPIYSLAADQSLIRSTLLNAPVGDRGVTLTAQLPIRSDQAFSPPNQRAGAAVQDASSDGLSRWFGSPVLTQTVNITLPPTPTATEGFAGDLVAREGVCAHVTIKAGDCRAALNQVVVSDRSATELGVGVGSSIAFRFSGQPPDRLAVVGVYQPGNATDAYWFGRNFFTFAPPPPTLGASPRFQLDALFVSDDTINSFGSLAFPFVTEELPLNPGAVDEAAIRPLQSALAGFSQTVAEQLNVTVASLLPKIISQLEDQEAQMGDIVALSALQLVIIALLLLYTMVSISAQTREHEVALARLRGHGLLGVLQVGLLEPISVLVVATPVGLALALVVVSVVAARLLLAGTPVHLDWLAGLAVGAAFAGGAAATILAGARLLLRPLHDQLRTSRVQGRRRSGGGVSDVVALSLAGAGLVELTVSGVLRGGRADPLAVLAPGLLVLAGAVVAMRLLPAVCGLMLARPGLQGTRAIWLALRRLVRLPEISRRVLLPALALGLVMFSVAAYAVADQNRAELAGFQVGADTVLTVRMPAGTDFVAAVRQADGSSHDAMAAIQYAWPGGLVLAVDSSRFPDVANWPAGISGQDASAVARWLTSPTAAGVLPAVVTPDEVSFNGQGNAAAIYVDGLDGRSIHLDGRLQSSALPRLGPSGSMVDLGRLEADSHLSIQTVQAEVWLSPLASADVERKLALQGITVISTQREASAKALLDSEGLPLAFEFMLLSALAGAVLAIGASIHGFAADARGHTYELAVLRASGWGRWTLLRAMLGEHFVVVLVACAIGAAGGAAGIALAIPSIPEFTDLSWSVPFHYNLPAAAMAALSVVYAVLLLLAGGVAALAMLRGAGFGHLRAGLT